MKLFIGWKNGEFKVRVYNRYGKVRFLSKIESELIDTPVSESAIEYFLYLKNGIFPNIAEKNDMIVGLKNGFRYNINVKKSEVSVFAYLIQHSLVSEGRGIILNDRLLDEAEESEVVYLGKRVTSFSEVAFPNFARITDEMMAI